MRCLALLCVAAGVVPAVAAQEPAPSGDLVPFLGAWCTECHGSEDPEGDLDLSALGRDPDDDPLPALLLVQDVLRAREMPPDDAPRPADEDYAAALATVERLLRLLEGRPLDPGRVTVRRLSRHEYANTVRDLFGVEVDVGAFPPDDLGYGFDNVGDVLTVSPLHLEKYAAAAERVAALALPDPDPEVPPIRRFEAERMRCRLDGAQRGDVAVLFTNAAVVQRVRPPRAGRYALRVVAWGTQAGDELPRMVVSVDGEAVATFDVAALRDRPGTFAHEVDLPGRAVDVAVAFVNDFYRPDAPDRARRDRNLIVDALEVEGPLDARVPTAFETRCLALDRGTGRPEARARPLLRRLLPAVWRRPVLRSEVSRLARLVAEATESGETFRGGLRWALQAALVSPHFLFRMEPAAEDEAGAVAPLDGFALASRLAYFLWSSTPDERLLELAGRGDFADADALVQEARRLLDDPRSRALAENFAAQWLELRRLDEVTPDPERFAGFDAELRRSMRTETELLFDHVLRENLPASVLLDADFSFLDERLARHYGIPDVRGAEFRRVALPGGERGGILTHAAVLTVTSNPTRTSPVKRGLWVLDNVLGDPPPPPPPGSDSFAGGEDSVGDARSLREQLALHRRDPGCAVCHDRMDALGLALENFDAIGRFRAADAGTPIDASGTLPDGRRIDGPAELRSYLAADPAFPRTLFAQLFVYAVGRAPAPDDRLAMDVALRALGPAPTLRDLVLATVRLDAFRKRRVAD